MSVNTSKYQITDNYRLHILDLIPQDDGEYQCQIMADMFTAWLVVCGQIVFKWFYFNTLKVASFSFNTIYLPQP